jgi:lipoate-protein ligase A
MKYIDFTLPTPAANLACDEALLDQCEAGGGEETLLFWEAREPMVVLGYANQAAREVDLEVCRARNVPVLRRCSGGGTVIQGPGCLSYSLILRIPETGPLSGIRGTNNHIMQRNRAALAPLVKGEILIQGHTDLALGGLKFSGNAQRRRRKFLIFHGTFLLNFDIPSMAELLRMPSKQPDYRQNRRHEEFLRNLHLPAETVKRALRDEWRATEQLRDLPMEKIEELCRTKYSSPEWNLKL